MALWSYEGPSMRAQEWADEASLSNPVLVDEDGVLTEVEEPIVPGVDVVVEVGIDVVVVVIRRIVCL